MTSWMFFKLQTTIRSWRFGLGSPGMQTRVRPKQSTSECVRWLTLLLLIGLDQSDCDLVGGIQIVNALNVPNFAGRDCPQESRAVNNRARRQLNCQLEKIVSDEPMPHQQQNGNQRRTQNQRQQKRFAKVDPDPQLQHMAKMAGQKKQRGADQRNRCARC